MTKRFEIELSDEEREHLQRWLVNPPKPYLRHRARAILKIADGQPIGQVAQELRIKIHRNAVSDWAHRFTTDRLEGLRICKGRGRKPGFSPSQPGASQNRA